MVTASYKSLIDAYGRAITYLRISLTEQCNFRCIYCMPREGVPVLSKDQYLTRDEIIRFVEIISRLGVTKVRLTGGEPLLRKDLIEIVQRIKRIGTIDDLAITTNASLLTRYLRPLQSAGLDRINISLDSLDAIRFHAVTRSRSYKHVLKGLFTALEMGFPVKLNIVVLKGLCDDEIIQFVALARDFPLEVRFIEFMPLCGTGWRPDLVKPIDTVRSVIQTHFDLMEIPRFDDVAQRFKINHGKGSVGFIASLTEPFCNTCSRIRLCVDGKIRPCLFSTRSISIRKLLRNNAPTETIVDAIRCAVAIKPAGNHFMNQPFTEENTSHSSDRFTTLDNPMIRTIGG